MSDSSGPHRLEGLNLKVEKMMDVMSQLLEAKSQQAESNKGKKRSKVAPEGGPPTTTAAAPGGRRPLLTQVMVLQLSELQQLRRYPSTAEEQRQNPKGQLTTSAEDQTFQLAWAQRSTRTAAKLGGHISQV